MRLRADDPPAPSLALVAGIALHEALTAVVPAALAAALRLKWPNDLVVRAAKLAGMLLERHSDPAHGDAVVVGVGVNLAHHPDLPDRATTSVAALTGGAAPSPDTLLAALAERFEAGLARWRGGDGDSGLAAVIGAWQTLAHPTGTPLSAALPDGSRVDGRFDGLDATGALRLRLADGGARVIHAGDVFLMRG